MFTSIRSVALLVVLSAGAAVSLAGCQASLSTPDSGASGTGGTGGTGGNGATGSGGAPGSGGRAGSGGAGGSVADPTDAGTSDGAHPAGDTGSDADASLPGQGRPVKASAGCGKANPATGARTIMTGGTNASFIVTLPAGYSATRPWPLGFAFHGYNLDEKTCAEGPECPGFKDLPAITVYQKSIGPGWEFPLDLLEPNIKFFTDTLALMKDQYCVDENRVFVAGVSSGGQFVNHLSCRFGDQLWAVSPIAAYVEPAVTMNCRGTPAEIIIHGITDNLAKNAHPVRDLYAMRNGCPMPTAALADAESKTLAAFNATPKREEIACVSYEGCTSNAVRYCVFSQVTYDGLTHGWPDLGGKLIQDFLDSLK